MISENESGPILSPAARLFRLVSDPRAAFASTAVVPKPLLVVGLAMLLTALATALTVDISLDVGRAAGLEAMVNQGMSRADAEAAFDSMRGVQRIGGIVAAPISILAGAALGGLIYWGVSNVVLGGRPLYKALLELVSVSLLIQLLGGMLRVPLVLSTGDPYASIGLGAFVESGSRFQPLLMQIDPFAIWAVYLVTIGLSQIYGVSTKRAAGVAIGLWIAGLLVFGLPGMFFSGLGA